MKGLSATLFLIYAVLIGLLFLLQPKKAKDEVHEARIIVVDADTEDPIKGAKVKITTSDEEIGTLTLKTNANGECFFEFTNPDELLTKAVASKSGYGKAEVEECELAYFLDDDLVIPLKKKDVVREGREIGAEGNLKVTLLWTDETVDLDLHVLEVLESSTFEICYRDGQLVSPNTGGKLDVDWIPGNTQRSIGENIFWQNPPRGQYRVWVECFNPESAPPTDCDVIVYRRNQEPKVFNLVINGYHDVQQVDTIVVE